MGGSIKAESICNEYEEEYIAKKVEKIKPKLHAINNPAAYIKKALSEDWLFEEKEEKNKREDLEKEIEEIADEFWKKVSLQLLGILGKDVHKSWISKIKFIDCREDTLRLKAENHFVSKMTEERYSQHILKSAQEYSKKIKKVEFQ